MRTDVDTVDLEAPSAVDDLDRALRRLGFVQVVGHGVDEAVAAALWAAMDELFALDEATKRGYEVSDPLANRGYRARGSEALAYSLGAEHSPPDLFESFNVGHDDRAGLALQAPTPWPTEVPAFRAAATDYLAEMATVAARLDTLLGTALGLPDLAERSRRGPDTMACIRYRSDADEVAAAPGQRRMGPHSDYTTFTILRADPVPGLEILGPDGWLAVVPDPGALLVNVGDLLAIWTDDAWPSTLHRVPLRGDGSDPSLRRSVAYFHYPDPDTAVAPLAGWRTAATEYSEVTVAEHLAAKLVGPKRHEPSTGATTLGGRPGVGAGD